MLGLHLIKNSSGRYGWAGNVPMPLAPMGGESRVYETVDEALEDAEYEGFSSRLCLMNGERWSVAESEGEFVFLAMAPDVETETV